MGSGGKEGGLFGLEVFLVFVFIFLGFFCLVFVISSIPERDKQHFQGEKKKIMLSDSKEG